MLMTMIKKYYKVRDHCHYTRKYRGAVHNVCNLRQKTPKEIPVVFHNGSKYGYHFISKELTEEFKGQFECLEWLSQNSIKCLYKTMMKNYDTKLY